MYVFDTAVNIGGSVAKAMEILESIEIKISKYMIKYIIKAGTQSQPLIEVVSAGGVEPPRIAPHEPESCVSTNSTMST